MERQPAAVRGPAVPRLPAAPGGLPVPLPRGHVHPAALPAGGPLAQRGGGGGLRLQQLLLHHSGGGPQQQGQCDRLHAHGARRLLPAVPGREAAGGGLVRPVPRAGDQHEPRADHLLPGHRAGALRTGRGGARLAGEGPGRLRATLAAGPGGRGAGGQLQPGAALEHLGVWPVHHPREERTDHPAGRQSRGRHPHRGPGPRLRDRLELRQAGELLAAGAQREGRCLGFHRAKPGRPRPHHRPGLPQRGGEGVPGWQLHQQLLGRPALHLGSGVPGRRGGVAALPGARPGRGPRALVGAGGHPVGGGVAGRSEPGARRPVGHRLPRRRPLPVERAPALRALRRAVAHAAAQLGPQLHAAHRLLPGPRAGL